MATPKVDPKLIEQLAAIQCTWQEIATHLNIDKSTLSKNKTYSAAIEAGRSKGHVILRRKQWDVAMNGSVRMLEWLGKQCLGQKDKSDVNVSGVQMFSIVSPSQGETLIGIKPQE